MRASRREILGAWLRIWTPPRDVEIPPVPRRTAALLAAGLVAVAVAGILLVPPALDRSKRRDAASDQRRQAAPTQTAQASIGQPFIVAGSLRDGRYAWCHLNPPPAESASGVGTSVRLPPVCSR